MICYRITQKKTGRAYIGSTTRSLSQRLYEHMTGSKKTAIESALRKYGKDAFLIEVIACAKSHADLLETETILIAQENTLAPSGYNIAPDGRGAMYGRRHSEETKRKMSEAQTAAKANLRGVPLPQETKRKISETLSKMRCGAGNPMFGRVTAQATKEKLSKRLSGSGNPFFGKSHPAHVIAKISAANRGRKQSQEHKEKVRAKLIGRPCSEETRRKIGEANRKKK